jgi:hypothetical protein
VAVRGNSFEGGSDETAITNGNSGGTSGTAFTSPTAGTGATVVYDDAQAHLGTFSCRTLTGGTSALAYVNWSITSGTSDYSRGHFRFTSLPPAQQGILRYLGGGVQCIRINVTTSGAIEVRNAANSVVGTTSATITAATWFRVEAHVTASTTVGAVELRYYASPNSSTPTETLNLTGLVLTATVDEIRFGVGAAMTNAVSVWIDNVAAEGTTWFGPALVTGTAARATTFGTTAAGTRTVLGTAARATTFGTTAAGVRTVSGTAARATTFTRTAAGVRTTFGNATRSETFAAAATGLRTVLGTGTRAEVFAAAAAGVRTVLAGGSRQTTFTAPASGVITVPDFTPGVLAAAAPTVDLAADGTGPTLTATTPRTSTLSATTSP